MIKNRLEAFSDGVIAILITIMVLELHAPASASPEALKPLIGTFLSYALSFIYLGGPHLDHTGPPYRKGAARCVIFSSLTA